MINSFQENEQKPFWHSLSLWPSDFKIYRGHLLAMNNVKYEYFVINGFQDNQQNVKMVSTHFLENNSSFPTMWVKGKEMGLYVSFDVSCLFIYFTVVVTL